MNVRSCAIIRQKDRVLFLQYDYPNGRVHCLPGGGLQEGESVAQSVVRELHEELGVDIEVGPLAYLGDVLRSEHYPQTVHIVFQARIVSGKPILNPKFTTARDVVWLPISDLPDKTLYPAINEALVEDLSAGKVNARYLGDCLQRKWL